MAERAGMIDSLVIMGKQSRAFFKHVSFRRQERDPIRHHDISSKNHRGLNFNENRVTGVDWDQPQIEDFY